MDEDSDIIARAVRFALDDNLGAARLALVSLPVADPIPMPAKGVPISFELIEGVDPGPTPTNAQRFRIYTRDGWRCRYCRRKLIVPPVLRLLGVIFSDFRGLRAGHHMKISEIEPAVNRVYPNVDHLHPQSYGGSHSDGNLVAACTVHNENKGNRSDWILLPILKDEWDGLCGEVYELAALANDFDDKNWFGVLGLHPGQTPLPRSI